MSSAAGPLTEQERVLRGLAPLTLFAYGGGSTAHFDPFGAGGAPHPYTYYAVYVNQERNARRAARL